MATEDAEEGLKAIMAKRKPVWKDSADDRFRSLGRAQGGRGSTVRDWARREVAPKIHDLDREHRFERAFLKGMADLHLLGICIPEEYGGAGMDYLSLGLASEELEYVDTHLRVIMSVHVGLNCMTLMVLGHRASRRRSTWCPRPRARRSRPTASPSPTRARTPSASSRPRCARATATC